MQSQASLKVRGMGRMWLTGELNHQLVTFSLLFLFVPLISCKVDLLVPRKTAAEQAKSEGIGKRRHVCSAECASTS